MKSINEFNVGDVIEVLSIDLSSYKKERMLSIGFTRGAIIKVIRIGPKMNLIVYDVRGAMVALREDESKFIYGRKYEEVDLWD